jgi:hypothetical protein
MAQVHFEGVIFSFLFFEGRHRREEESTSSSFGRYKNLPLVDQNQMRIREQQKELTELGFAYREERARRKALQRDLRREQQSKESLAMEVNK